MASISAIFGTKVPAAPPTTRAPRVLVPSKSIITIECSSRPQKKATKHHMKTRPKKSQPWDIKRKPTVYPPLPPLPADFTVVSSAPATTDIVAVEVVETQ